MSGAFCPPPLTGEVLSEAKLRGALAMLFTPPSVSRRALDSSPARGGA